METGIFEAIKDNNLELVRTFPNVNVTYPDNYSALMVACEEADLPIVQDLIARGATINSFNDYGNSPLILAAFYGRDDIVQELLTHGALIDAMNSNNIWTALMATSAQNCLSTVRLLIDAGADINILNRENKSAFRYAHNAGHQEIKQELLLSGAIPLTNPEEEPHFIQYPPYHQPILPGPLNARIDLGGKSCSICSELYNIKPLYIVNPCHHIFHQACLDPWINTNHYTCPNCRGDMKNVQELTIDLTPGPEYPKENYFLGGNFYNKYQKYINKLKNF